MSKRNKLWARKERRRLIKILGGRCFECGARRDLTFDCIEPRGHAHHKGSTDQRVCFYRREFYNGNLGLLCEDCNARKADGPPLPNMRRKLHRVRVLAWMAATVRDGNQKLKLVKASPIEFSNNPF